MYSDGASVQNILQHAGRVTINFNRKPQRFLKAGETKITFSGSKVISNPTDFPALPLIRVNGTGAGVLNVGNYKVTISSITNFIDIDSELQDAYYGATNLNSYITIDNQEFPKLLAGNTTISYTGSITSVEVTPRWWTI
jgi:phage-related protein